MPNNNCRLTVDVEFGSSDFHPLGILNGGWRFLVSLSGVQ